MKRALEFTHRLLQCGVDNVIYGDTTGEGTPDRAYDLFSAVLRLYPNKDIHIAHFHESRGWGMACSLAALHAGIVRFETSLGGIGGQPAKIIDRVVVPGTGPRYTPSDITGNARSEDFVVMLDEMGIETGVHVDKVLELGRLLEKVLGRRLRSYCTETGRIPKGHTGR
jgi:hydroxymethylglutaryl-CoA lyase